MRDLHKIIAFNLIVVSCLATFITAKAGTADSTQLSLSIQGGSLSLIAPESATFSAQSFSFEGQQSSDNAIGDISVTDSRGTETGWNVDITASNWTDGSKIMTYNGDGSETGQLSLDIPEKSQVTVNAGDSDLTNFQMGTDASFTSSNSIINLVQVSAGSGSGQYNFSGLNASQFIPGNQVPGAYSTNLTLTIS